MPHSECLCFSVSKNPICELTQIKLTNEFSWGERRKYLGKLSLMKLWKMSKSWQWRRKCVYYMPSHIQSHTSTHKHTHTFTHSRTEGPRNVTRFYGETYLVFTVEICQSQSRPDNEQWKTFSETQIRKQITLFLLCRYEILSEFILTFVCLRIEHFENRSCE